MARTMEQIIPHLLGGISKQPPYLRGIDQSAWEENTNPTFSKGLLKRPHTTFLKTLGVTRPCFIKALSFGSQTLGEGEDYLLMVTEGGLSLISLNDLSEIQISLDDEAKKYLAGQNFTCVTWGNFTYILNKGVITRMSGESPAQQAHQALIFIKQAVSKTRYEIKILDKEVSVTTPDQGTLSTDQIATDLENQLRSALGDKVTLTRQGSQLLLSSPENFTITGNDSFGNNALLVIKDAVNDFSYLPKTAFEGFTVEVTTDPRAKKDSYYLKYTEGVWKETVKPGLQNAFDPATMPHVLEYMGHNKFVFKQEQWGERLVGDEKSSPEPSFVGQSLSDLFAYKSRLGVLAGDNVTFSEVDAPENFWLTTTATTLDSDPLDLIVSATAPIDLKHAIPTSDGNLLLFASSDQFILNAKEGLTPHTINVTVLSHFDSSKAQPINVEQSVLFASPSSCFSDIKEMTPSRNEVSPLVAENLTDQVPDFIPHEVTKMVSIPQAKAVFVFSKTTPQTLYVYKYQWKGETKVQMAWTQWVFAYPLVDIETHQGIFYLISGAEGAFYLESMTLENVSLPSCTVPSLLLDRMSKPIESVYDITTYFTRVTLPYPSAEEARVFADEEALPIHRREGNTLWILGNYEKAALVVGLPYTFKYTFAPFIPKQQGGSGQVVSVPGGTLFMRTLTVTTADTKAFAVQVEVNGKTQSTYVFNGNHTSVPHANARIPLLSSAQGLKVTLIHDDPSSCTFQNASWSGIYAKHLPHA